jgi:hypothetical protein
MHGYAKRNSENIGLKPTKYKFKNYSPQRHGGTEFYLVNCACGAVNKTMLFSVPLCLCGELVFSLFDVEAIQLTRNV